MRRAAFALLAVAAVVALVRVGTFMVVSSPAHPDGTFFDDSHLHDCLTNCGTPSAP